MVPLLNWGDYWIDAAGKLQVEATSHREPARGVRAPVWHAHRRATHAARDCSGGPAHRGDSSDAPQAADLNSAATFRLGLILADIRVAWFLTVLSQAGASVAGAAGAS